ncbi:MAG: hypothetical protein ACRC42_01175 [Mycoplasma sp.]
MRTIFKQIYRSFSKNIFLIIGFSVLIIALSFIMSSAVNIALSFQNSINKLNKDGNASKVVSSNGPHMGYLDFSYEKSTNETKKIIQSTFPLVQEPDGKFIREKNTIFPYSYSDFYFINNSGVEKKSREGNLFKRQVEYFPESTTIDDMFKVYEFQKDNTQMDQKPFWEWSIDVLRGPMIPNVETAGAFSFVDSDGKVLLDPSNLVFNQYGIPSFVMKDGILTDQFSFATTLTKVNKKIVEKEKEIYDEKGFGKLDIDIFNRSDNKADLFHNMVYTSNTNPADYEHWAQKSSLLYMLSKYIKPVTVSPYVFTMNLKDSTGFIKQILTLYPELIDLAFKNTFEQLETTRNDGPEMNYEEISNPIEISNDGKIYLNLSDSQIPDDDSEIFLKNFASYLGRTLTNEISSIFNDNFEVSLNENKIERNQEREYFYRDNKRDLDYLFVPKNNNGINDIVIEKGSNIEESASVEKWINSLQKDPKKGYNEDTYRSILEILQTIPKSKYPPTGDDIDKPNEYIYLNFLIHCLNELVKLFDASPGSVITPEVKTTNYFKISSQLLNWVGIKFEANFVYVKSDIGTNFNTVYIGHAMEFNLFENLFVVISNGYADANKKRIIPSVANDKVSSIWEKEMEELKNLSINDSKRQFAEWMEKLTEDEIVGSIDIIENLVSKFPELYNLWVEKIPSNYKIFYRQFTFLIRGTGLSPDFAFPMISPTSPMPAPEKQAIIYINNSTFNNFKLPSADIASYYAYSSNYLSDEEIIEVANNLSINSSVGNVYKIVNIKEAHFLPSPFMRSSFPEQMISMIIIFCVISMVFIMLLSLFIVYLLMKSILKKLIEPMSICIANGVSLKKIILAGITNISIWTLSSVVLGYIISIFVQGPFISILSPVWLIPISSIGFNFVLFFLLIMGSLLLFGGIFGLILYRKFKKPTPSILNNKDDVDNNFATEVVRSSKFRIPLPVKLSFGFSSINLGRLGLLTGIGAIALGCIVTLFTINTKFSDSRQNTITSREYKNEYNFKNINESTGLYKTQKYTDFGISDPSQGIISLYPDGNTSPYKEGDLIARKIEGNSIVVDEPVKYLTNLVMPSFDIYNKLNSGDMSTFFNGVASVFLLDLEMKLAGFIEVRIWDHIRPYFPEWVVSQLESQAKLFEESIVEYYGELLYDFIRYFKDKKIVNGLIAKSIPKGSDLPSSGNLEINDITENDYGHYILKGKKQFFNTDVYSKPYYLWSDTHEQKYENKSGTRETSSIGGDIEFEYDQNFYNTINKNKPVEWLFFPAKTDKRLSLDPSKFTTTPGIDITKTKFTDNFLKFITVIYNDHDVTKNDSKISFGILPFEEEYDEKYTKVNATITAQKDLFNNTYTPKKPHIEILGIQNDSSHFKLNDLYTNENISGLISSNEFNVEIPVIINAGATIEYNLGIGDTFDIKVNNNSLVESADTINAILGLENTPVNANAKMKVVGINSDSFGARFYINKDIANKITSLDSMYFYGSNTNAKDVEGTIIKPRSSDDIFNSIVSSDSSNPIAINNLPFYTMGNIWNNATNPSELNASIPVEKVYDSLLTINENILLQTAKSIQTSIDPNFVYDDSTLESLRLDVSKFIISNYANHGMFMQMLEVLGQEELLQFSISSILPNDISISVFDLITSLTTIIVIIGSLILLPLLMIVSTITSMSMVQDLTNKIVLMKILGYSNRNILMCLSLMYIPVIILTTIIGLAVTFATSYGTQYLIYSMTSIFISQFVNPWIFILGVVGVVSILFLSLIYIHFHLKNSKMQEVLKF